MRWPLASLPLPLARAILARGPLAPARLAGEALATGALAAASLVAQQPSRPDSTRADSVRPVLLQPVIVSVTRAPAEAARVPFAVSTVGPEEIARGRATRSLGEALATVPGIYLADRHNPSQDDILSIRGFGARSAFGVRGVKILLDGIPQTLPDGQGQLSNVELAGVRRIEVLRGPASSLYGNASGGVIALWSDLERPASAQPLLRAQAGAYGMRKWYAGLALPAGQGTLKAELSSLVARGFRVHSSAETRRAALRYGVEIASGTRLAGQVLVADSPWLDDPGALTQAEASAEPSAANPRNVRANAGKSVRQGLAGVALEHRATSGRSLEASLFGLRRDLENSIPSASIRLGRWAWGLRLLASQPVALGRRPGLVTAGADAQWQRDDRLNWSPDRTRLTRDQLERVAELGPFLELRADLTQALRLTLGARYDRIAFRADDRLLADGNDSGLRIMAAPSASAGIAVHLSQALQPYASVATSFETPTTTELGNRPGGAGGFNPELEPQHATNYEAGLRGSLADRLEYAVALYRARVRGELIPFEVPGDPGRRFFRNAGSALHRGAELSLVARPVSSLTVLAALTLTAYRFQEFRTATDTLDGKRLPGVPARYLHGSLRYQAPARLWVALDLTASSAVYANDANTVQAEPWQTVGLRATWEARAGPWRVRPFAAVSNLWDRRYIGSLAVNAQFGRYFEPAPGRNALVGVELLGPGPGSAPGLAGWGTGRE